MKFGLRYCNIGRYINPAHAVELVQAGEEAGFESAWTVEHTVVPDGYQSAYPYTADGKMPGGTDDFPLPDPLIWMAYVAAAAMRELWSSARPTFHGDFVHFDAAYCKPQPVNKTVPIIVGGDSTYAARRAGRLGDGYFPARGAPMDLIELARRTAEEHGRDPAALEITASLPDDLEDIPRLAAAGVKRLTVPVASGAGPRAVISRPEDALAWRETIEKYAEL